MNKYVCIYTQIFYLFDKNIVNFTSIKAIYYFLYKVNYIHICASCKYKGVVFCLFTKQIGSKRACTVSPREAI